MRPRSSSSRSSVPEWRAALLLVLLFALSLPGVTTRIYASDEIQFFAYLRSLWFDRDVDFENEYRHFVDTGVADTALFRETFLDRTSATGQRVNFGTMGSAVLWAPFYAIADLGVRTGVFTAPRDGYSRPYVAAVCYGSALYGFAALLLSWAVARRVLGDSIGLAPPTATAAIWIGTPLVFYMYVAPVMAHATSAFAVALFVWLWLCVRERWSASGALALGAAAALMTMVREQDAFFAVVPALDFVWTLLRQRQAALLRSGLAGLLAFAVVFTPQALAYLALNGRIAPSQVTGRKMDWLSPHALDVLVSTEHGFFVWTPLAALALAGLLWACVSPAAPALGRPRQAAQASPRGLAAALVVMTALQVWITGAVLSWTLAGAFGQRRFLALTVVLVTGLAALLTRLGRPRLRVVAGLVIAVCIWWNLGLLVQFGTGQMNRQRLEPATNAYRTFVTVPLQLPAIVHRYLFDRSSFYRATPPAGASGSR